MSFRFKREERLKRRNDIREVFGKGKRYSCEGAKLFVLKNNLLRNRICFSFTKTSSRSFGSAVARNRAKRLGREAFRLIKGKLGGCQSGHDLILLVYPDVKTLKAMMEKMEILFKKAGIFSVINKFATDSGVK